MKKFYIAFTYGEPYNGYYYEIKAKDYEAVKAKAVKLFGDRYTYIYDTADKAHIEKHSLKRLRWWNLPLIGKI